MKLHNVLLICAIVIGIAIFACMIVLITDVQNINREPVIISIEYAQPFESTYLPMCSHRHAHHRAEYFPSFDPSPFMLNALKSGIEYAQTIDPTPFLMSRTDNNIKLIKNGNLYTITSGGKIYQGSDLKEEVTDVKLKKEIINMLLDTDIEERPTLFSDEAIENYINSETKTSKSEKSEVVPDADIDNYRLLALQSYINIVKIDKTPQELYKELTARGISVEDFLEAELPKIAK